MASVRASGGVPPETGNWQSAIKQGKLGEASGALAPFAQELGNGLEQLRQVAGLGNHGVGAGGSPILRQDRVAGKDDDSWSMGQCASGASFRQPDSRVICL